MDNKIMTITEVEFARMNLENIESKLGHKVTPGMIDVTKLGSSIMSEYDAFIVAQNIKAVEDSMSSSDEEIIFRLKSIALLSVIMFIILIVAIVARGGI